MLTLIKSLDEERTKPSTTKPKISVLTTLFDFLNIDTLRDARNRCSCCHRVVRVSLLTYCRSTCTGRYWTCRGTGSSTLDHDGGRLS